jgi:hypothetical protein
MPRNEAKSQFIQHSLSVLQSKPRQQKTLDSVQPDHPFYSQYNRLKMRNLLEGKDQVGELSKMAQRQLDGECERQFERFVRYRMSYNNKLIKIGEAV